MIPLFRRRISFPRSLISLFRHRTKASLKPAYQLRVPNRVDTKAEKLGTRPKFEIV
ncbi:MAG: hypothetical protein QW835_00275 [Candidatus Hadarchaeum sp.]